MAYLRDDKVAVDDGDALSCLSDSNCDRKRLRLFDDRNRARRLVRYVVNHVAVTTFSHKRLQQKGKVSEHRNVTTRAPGLS